MPAGQGWRQQRAPAGGPLLAPCPARAGCCGEWSASARPDHSDSPLDPSEQDPLRPGEERHGEHDHGCPRSGHVQEVMRP